MDFTDTAIRDFDPTGTVFTPEVGPAVTVQINKSVSPFVPLEQELDKMPKAPVIEKNKKYPEYMEEENARKLYEHELQEGESLSPLSFVYYLSRDNGNRSDPLNLDLKEALNEQGKFFELYMSKQKLNPTEWETALQNSSGWKEIFNAVDIPNFGEKTRRYLLVHSFIADANHDTRLANVLRKTATLIESNIKQLSNGA